MKLTPIADRLAVERSFPKFTGHLHYVTEKFNYTEFHVYLAYQWTLTFISMTVFVSFKHIKIFYPGIIPNLVLKAKLEYKSTFFRKLKALMVHFTSNIP